MIPPIHSYFPLFMRASELSEHIFQSIHTHRTSWDCFSFRSYRMCVQHICWLAGCVLKHMTLIELGKGRATWKQTYILCVDWRWKSVHRIQKIHLAWTNEQHVYLRSNAFHIYMETTDSTSDINTQYTVVDFQSMLFCDVPYHTWIVYCMFILCKILRSIASPILYTTPIMNNE